MHQTKLHEDRTVILSQVLSTSHKLPKCRSIFRGPSIQPLSLDRTQTKEKDQTK